jgi:lysophospholipid acyltransferase (LPLAT)-like uncharacterized protein
MQMHNAWRLNSWDQFYLPKPFSRISIKLCLVRPEDYENRSIDEIQTQIQDALYKINAQTRFEAAVPIQA